MLSTSSVKETDVEKIQYYYLVVCDGTYINGPSAGLWKQKKTISVRPMHVPFCRKPLKHLLKLCWRVEGLFGFIPKNRKKAAGNIGLSPSLDRLIPP